MWSHIFKLHIYYWQKYKRIGLNLSMFKNGENISLVKI